MFEGLANPLPTEIESPEGGHAWTDSKEKEGVGGREEDGGWGKCGSLLIVYVT